MPTDRVVEQPLSRPVPDRLWLMDLGSGDIVWSAERDPDGEQIDAVEYVRSTTIAELVAALEGLFSQDVLAVLAEMKADWSIPANQLAADATATSGRNILPGRVLKILRALHEFGLAEFGPLYNEDEPKMQGRGYWLSNAGVRTQTALTKVRSAL